MFKIKSEMLRDSSKSLASHSLLSQIISFLVVFFVVILLESIIPSFISLPMVTDEFIKQGLVGADGKVSYSDSYRIALGVSASPNVMIPTLLCTVFGTLTSLVYCRWIEIRKLSSMGVRKGTFGSYFLGLLVGTVLMSAIVLLSIVCGVNSIKTAENTNYRIVLLFALGWIVQGMSEEFVFRGYLMTTIGGQHSPWLAVGISAMAFALAHAGNPGFNVLSCTNLVLFGVFAGVYMICSDNIWGVCGIHSVWNFLQGNFYGISVSGTGGVESVFVTSSKNSHAFLSGGNFGIEGSIFTTAVLLAGIGIVLLRMKKKYKD